MKGFYAQEGKSPLLATPTAGAHGFSDFALQFRVTYTL